MYVYPSVTINDMTFTASRWGQFPTITYDTSDVSVTAGHEIVSVAADLSNITIYIEDGVSTNLQIKTAINAWDGTTQSLYPRDLVSIAIVSGHNADTNTDEGPESMTGASFVFPRLNVQPFYEPLFIQQVYYGVYSNQAISSDLIVDAAVGSADGSNPKYIASAMFNIFGDDLTKDANYLAGVIGAYSITGTKASTYPSGAVLAQISDGVTEADGAVVAYIDGDGDVTTANAAFKAMSNNSTAGSGFNYGLDLTSPAHDGFNALAILKADLRLSNDVCTLQGSGVPVDGTTGAGFAGPGSLYIRVNAANSNAYINCNTKASPTWKLITRAA